MGLASQIPAITLCLCGAAPTSSWVSMLKCWLFRNSWHVNKCKSSKKNSKCWIHWLLPTQLLSMQCCCFWQAAVLHNTFVFFFSLCWEQVIVLMGLCVSGASFSMAQSTVPRVSELSIVFQTGFEYVWGSIIFTQPLFSITHSCEGLALQSFHCWRSTFQNVSCPLNTSCTVFWSQIPCSIPSEKTDFGWVAPGINQCERRQNLSLPLSAKLCAFSVWRTIVFPLFDLFDAYQNPLKSTTEMK